MVALLSHTAMATRVPARVALATREGDAHEVRAWLESGGDPNAKLAPNDTFASDRYKLLCIASRVGHCEVMKVLLDHGADVQYLYTYNFYDSESPWSESESEDEDGPTQRRPLDMAMNNNHHGAVRLLVAHGADMKRIKFNSWIAALRDPLLLRIAIVAGADLTAPCCHGKTPEAYCREERLPGLRERSPVTLNESWLAELIANHEESLSILEGVRLAGSYKQYVLRDFKGLLRTRSLLARGRALLGPQTPEVVARLFGGRMYRFARQRRPLRPAGVPDPAFWLVMEYWRLGNWRRP